MSHWLLLLPGDDRKKGVSYDTCLRKGTGLRRVWSKRSGDRVRKVEPGGTIQKKSYLVRQQTIMGVGEKSRQVDTQTKMQS